MLPYVLLEQQFMWAGQINICQFIKPLICEYSRYQQLYGYPRPINCENLSYFGMSDFDYAPDWEWIPDFIDPKNITESGSIGMFLSIFAVLSLLLWIQVLSSIVEFIFWAMSIFCLPALHFG